MLKQDQLGRMTVLSGLLFVMLALGTDGVPPVVQNRRPLPMTEGLPKLPSALGGYKYVILKLGPLQLTRKGVALATAASCLSFTVSNFFWFPRSPLEILIKHTRKEEEEGTDGRCTKHRDLLDQSRPQKA